MANYIATDTDFTLVANAIRAKTGDSGLLEWPIGFKTAIDNIVDIKTVGPAPVVSVTDAAPLDAEGLVVNIEPVQDLHGYDSPWPAGGGKNLYNSATFPSQTKNGITCTNNGDGSFTLNGTATTDIFFDVFTAQFNPKYSGTPLPSAEYRLTGCPSGGSSQTYYLYTIPNHHPDNGSGVTFTDEILGGSIYVKSGVTLNNLVFNPMIRLASNGDDTFTPYSNICPITGWTGAKVTRTGKNLLDETYRTNTGNNVRFNMLAYYHTFLKGGMSYTISASSSPNQIQIYDETNTRIANKYVSPLTFTPDRDVYVHIDIYYATVPIDGLSAVQVQLELGSIATEYEPYQGDTYDITFPSEAGTVYGGTLDVVNGVLTVESAYALLNNPDKWIFTSGTADLQRYDVPIVDRKIYNDSYSGLMCSYVPCVYGAEPYGRWNSSTGYYFSIKGSAITLDKVKADASAGKIAIAYELATPITYTLTPQQIALLRGNNALWADTGDTNLTYNVEVESEDDSSDSIIASHILRGKKLEDILMMQQLKTSSSKT